MSATFGWLSIVPPALAIGVALIFRRVLPALSIGVLCAVIIQNLETPHLAPARAIDHLVAVITDPDSARLIVFSVLIGGLLQLMRDSRGFDAFVAAIQRFRGAHERRTTFGLTWLIGATLILETYSNVLINGATVGPLYDRLGLSRVRLAYFIHTIGINVVALVLINSWGAFYLALIAAQQVPNPMQFLVRAAPYALYCWISLIVVALVMRTGFTIGPLRALEADSTFQAPPTQPASGDPRHSPRVRYMIVPILTLVGGVLLSLWATGAGSIMAGNGSVSVLYALAGALVVTAALMRIDRIFTSSEIEKKIIEGSARFLDVGFLIVLALALGRLTQELGVGAFIAQSLQDSLRVELIPALVFSLAAVMSFATGTSYGTFSIVTPIALPVGVATGISPELLFGCCIAGGVFGDNTSPISDTSIVTSVAANVSVLDHVRTQLPYALIAAALSICGYLVLGCTLPRDG
jgi:Na+/H+ antiporter NhaC